MPFPAVGVGMVAAGAGLLVIAIADNLARTASTGARPLFWAGYLAIVLPIAALVLLSRLTRGQLLWLVLALGADVLIVLLQRALTPWVRARSIAR